MLELIAIVGGLFLLFYLPYEANKVRNGWVRKRFKGAPADFPAAYAKAMKSFGTIGIVLGCVGIVLAPLAPEQGEWVFKLLGAAIWFGVAAVAFRQRARLEQFGHASPRNTLAAAFFVCALAAGAAAAQAADWVERPYNPPVGSRWTIQRDLFTEENDNGAISKKTFKITSDLKIVGKDATGFSVIYARRAFSYDNDDKSEEAMARPAVAALQGIEYHVTTDLAGKPLRVDNLNDVKTALRNLIGSIVSSNKDPNVAAVLRQMLAPMLDIDEKSAADLYMDQLPDLALAQNTGLKLGETRRDSVVQPNPIGKLVINRALTLAEADPASGDAKIVLTESYDPESMRAFQTGFLERLRSQGTDVKEPEKTVKEMEMSLDNRSEFKVVDGMTHSIVEDSTMLAKLVGTRRVIKSRKVVTVTEAR